MKPLFKALDNNGELIGLFTTARDARHNADEHFTDMAGDAYLPGELLEIYPADTPVSRGDKDIATLGEVAQWGRVRIEVEVVKDCDYLHALDEWGRAELDTEMEGL